MSDYGTFLFGGTSIAQFFYHRWAMKRDIIKMTMERVDKLETKYDALYVKYEELQVQRSDDKVKIARLEERLERYTGQQ